jgi:hypothetical protein
MSVFSPPRPALVTLYFTFQFFIWLEVVETDHLITARGWAFLLRKPIRAKDLLNSCR